VIAKITISNYRIEDEKIEIENYLALISENEVIEVHTRASKNLTYV
jgi:hypothetical protein